MSNDRRSLWRWRMLRLLLVGLVLGFVITIPSCTFVMIRAGHTAPLGIDLVGIGAMLSGIVLSIFEYAPRSLAVTWRIRKHRILSGQSAEVLRQVALVERRKDEAMQLTRSLESAPGDARVGLAEATDRAPSEATQLAQEISSADVLAAVEKIRLLRAADERVTYYEARTLGPRLVGFARTCRSTAALSLTALAAAIAGRSRRELHDAWLADQCGAPEAGVVPSDGKRIALAVGNVVAALKMRGHDLGAPLWRPVEWLVSVEKRINTFATLVVGSGAVYFDVTEGLRVLLLDRSAPLSILGGGILGLAKWTRRLRGIELAGPSRPDEKR